MPVTIPVNHFNLDQIAGSGQCFSWVRLDEGRYAIESAGRYVEAAQEGNALFLSCEKAVYNDFWKGYFDLDTDYGAFLRRIPAADACLTSAARYGAGVRILRQDLWEIMVSFLISQNNNIPRIIGCLQRLRKTYGRPLSKTSKVSAAFPRPDELAGASEADFRALGLGYRARYLAAMTQRMKDGGLDELAGILKAQNDDQVRERLLSFTGVGRKVADCIALYGLHRLDMFPVDTHIKGILAHHYPSGFPFDEYNGCRGVMQQYLFFADLAGETGRQAG